MSNNDRKIAKSESEPQLILSNLRKRTLESVDQSFTSMSAARISNPNNMLHMEIIALENQKTVVEKLNEGYIYYDLGDNLMILYSFKEEK